jgi:predicted NBD/HSP70 family sugar kinase
MKILVIDVGGNNVKVRVQGSDETRKFPSGLELTPAHLLEGLWAVTADWDYDRITIGFPAPVRGSRIHQEPVNLGKGWVGFDFAAALGRPVRLINDAAMQALGSYEGGRMLFLGLGTGLGSAMVLDGVVAPLELGHLPYRKGRSFEEYLGEAARQRLGRVRWQEMVFDVVERFRDAFLVDYVVLGGGNAKKLDELPPGCRRGSNENAFVGGVRVWEEKDEG